MKIFFKLLKYIINLNQYKRKIFLFLLDNLSILISFLLSLWLSNNEILISKNYYSLIFLIIINSITFLFISNQYKSIIRYSGSNEFYKILINNLFFISILFIQIKILIFNVDLKALIIFFILISSFMTFMRLVMRDLIIRLTTSNRNNIKKRVGIYGTGLLAVQLYSALKFSLYYDVITFIDDKKENYARDIQGIKINRLQDVDKLNLDRILISTEFRDKNKISDVLNFIREKLPSVDVLKIPSYEDLASGKESIDSLKPIMIEDLLFRNRVLPIPEFYGPGINNKVVLVTGAGGSIGSELSIQILKLNPSKIILVDFSEASMFLILQSLNKFSNKKIQVFAELGSTTDPKFIDTLFKKYNPQIVFHASAYKHVSLLESNRIEAIKNNIFSTLYLCEFARASKVEQLILISSDKAVRPSSVMGATKRISELILGAFVEDMKKENEKGLLSTRFSSVRFGNVLGSSGSVVNIFQKQIKDGGPLTITHPEVIRYFMTISEAAQLVIQSAFLSRGEGEVFLLDMGEPIKIRRLAEQMIFLSGLKLKDKSKDGNIEIIYTGLKPGEKLKEELLIGGKAESTKHPLIYKTNETCLPYDLVVNKLKKLQKHLEEYDEVATIKIINELVPEKIT